MSSYLHSLKCSFTCRAYIQFQLMNEGRRWTGRADTYWDFRKEVCACVTVWWPTFVYWLFHRLNLRALTNHQQACRRASFIVLVMEYSRITCGPPTWCGLRWLFKSHHGDTQCSHCITTSTDWVIRTFWQPNILNPITYSPPNKPKRSFVQCPRKRKRKSLTCDFHPLYS